MTLPVRAPRRDTIVSKRSYIYMGAACLVALTSACAPRAVAPEATRPALVAKVEGQAVQGAVVSGLVRSTANQDVPSEYGGRVIALRANVGDRVVAGQVLAELDTSVAALQLAQAQAQLRQSAAELDAALREEARLKTLVAAGAASTQDLDNAMTAARRAEAQRQAAAAQAALAGRARDKAQIRAPVSGVIAARQAELGAMVSAGATLFALDVGGDKEIQAPVPTTLVQGLKVGDLVDYRYGQEGGKARLIGLAERVAGGDGRVARLRLESGAPPVGASVQIHLLPRATKGTVSVPLSAIITDRTGHRSVMALDAQGAARPAPVEIVSVTGTGVLVEGALAPGQSIVAAGGEFLKAGERVRPLPFTR